MRLTERLRLEPDQMPSTRVTCDGCTRTSGSSVDAEGGGALKQPIARPLHARLRSMGEVGSIHHLELWVEDLELAEREWGWLLDRLGYHCADRWRLGQSWKRGEMYFVFESGPDRVPGRHDRKGAGINHVALRVGSWESLDALVQAAPSHGWTLMFPDRYPFAGGSGHCAAYLENTAGFEVELVADQV